MGRFFNSKLLLNFCNFLFLLCGTALIVFGFYLFTDTKRILLSRILASTSEQLDALPQPLFYYISIGITFVGLLAVIAAIVGFWATCLHSYCFLSVYFLTVVILLLGESVACLAITLWPQCLGISLDETKMVKSLQAFYGIPGKEQFTIAMDLAQTRFGCCGMNSEINYDTSLWKLQGYGQRDWIVPLSCCVLGNAGDKMAHLDPKPANETQCESLEKSDYENYRYTEPCLPQLDNWYHSQYALFLCGSLVIAIVEFGVLLSIVITCTNIPSQSLQMDGWSHGRSHTKSHQKFLRNTANQTETELQTSRKKSRREHFNGTEELKEIYIQPPALNKQRHNTTFRPISKDYTTSLKNFYD